MDPNWTENEVYIPDLHVFEKSRLPPQNVG